MNLPPSQSDRGHERDERITLFPSFGYYDRRREGWRAVVQGRVYDLSRIPISTRILLKGLKRALKATDAELAGDLFRQRIQGFTAKPIRGRRIRVELSGHLFTLRRKSKRNGAFLSIVKIPNQLLPQEIESDTSPTHSLPIRLYGGDRKSELNGNEALTASTIYLIPRRGVSVISDIDDTIKATDVSSRHSMLANTFLKPFTAIEGMSDLYRQWQAAGAVFHYVSSSPWQLFQPLSDLCQLSQFPAGSMHLRYFRIRDEMFKRWRPSRRKGKTAIIAGLIKKLPERRFVLVGDSGERDAEIYRFLARRFPQQVTAILIRQLAPKPLNNQRIDRLRDVPAGTEVRLFEFPDELSDFFTRVQTWHTAH